MEQKLSLQQKLLQKLSPQQIQVIKLLEIPTMQLEQRIKKELEENRFWNWNRIIPRRLTNNWMTAVIIIRTLTTKSFRWMIITRTMKSNLQVKRKQLL